MPILNVKVGAPRSDQLTHQIASALGELTANILHKPPQVTAIAITYVDPRDWIIAGRSLAERSESSFYFDIKITDETNTKSEKAQYIAAAFDAFARLLPNLNPESYIHVEDVRAAAYGFAGKTQEFRFHHPAS